MNVDLSVLVAVATASVSCGLTFDMVEPDRCSARATMDDIPLMSNQEVSRLFIRGACDSLRLNEFPVEQLRPARARDASS